MRQGGGGGGGGGESWPRHRSVPVMVAAVADARAEVHELAQERGHDS